MMLGDQVMKIEVQMLMVTALITVLYQKNLLPKIKRTYIDRKITASDHWPLWMEMDTENNN